MVLVRGDLKMGKMGVNDTYATVIGAVLGLVGLLGFAMPSPLLGLFGVNMLQSVIHLVGATGIYFGKMGQGRQYNMVLGVIALVVAILGFVVPDLMLSLLNINQTITYLHVAIAVVSLGVYYGVKE